MTCRMAAAVVATLATVLASGVASAQSSRRMEFQLTGRAGTNLAGGALAVSLEYLDPSVVDARLADSRALPVSVTVRNTSTRTVPFDYEAVRLVLGGDEVLRPVAAAAVAAEFRKMKQVPGFLRFLADQSTAFQPRALESALGQRQLRGGGLAPGGSRTGLVYFIRPPSFSATAFNGVLLLDVEGHAPQLLATGKIGVETKAPEQPGFTARLWTLWTTYLSPTPPAFNKSYALIIGIGRYHHLPPLASPAQDVRKMKDYLEAQGFDEVVTLVDEQVTPGAFRRPQLYLQGKMQANDRFLFYYSGHGTTSGTGMATRGFLPLADETDDGRHARSIAMLDLVKWLKGLATQHLLVVLDSCFSGLAVDGTEVKAGTIRQPNPKVDAEALNRMSRGPARYLLMAGTAGQQSFGGEQWNGSLFTDELLTGLRRDADLYKDRIVTARELYVWLRPAVEKAARRANRELTPLFLDLGPGGASRGEFVFVQ
jgi:uncharacterized caspase-like protein